MAYITKAQSKQAINAAQIGLHEPLVYSIVKQYGTASIGLSIGVGAVRRVQSSAGL
jgi:hypothetical protein